MALGDFVAGAYTGTYNALDIGILERGYELSFRVAKELINQTDAYAQSVIDAIYQGLADVFLQGTFLEWNNNTLAMVTPYAALLSTAASFLGPGVIGRLDTAVADILVLTDTTGTPAENKPASLTATYAMIAENFNVNWLMGPWHRKIPFRMRIYPYDDLGVIKYFTVT